MSRISSTLKIFLVCCVCFLTTLTASARENILHTVEISQSGDSYSLKLKADEMVRFKKRVENKNSAYFELKNIVPSDDIETVYNDVSSLDGVIIQQIDKSKIRIYVNGYLAAKTKISIETAGNVLKSSREIVVNRPRSEYASVAPIEDYEDKDWENNGFNLGHLLNVINGGEGNGVDWTMVVSFFAIVFSIMGVKKAFSNGGQAEPAIGITPSTRKISEELGVQPQAVKNPREELMRTLNEVQASREQVSLNSGYARPDASRQNYAINSYNQAQNFNPYSNAGSTITNPNRKVVQNKVYSEVPVQSVQRPLRRPVTDAISQTAPKKPNVNMNNMKFLESVTKIYEQSGRKDLAQGIKSNLSKQRIAI